MDRIPGWVALLTLALTAAGVRGLAGQAQAAAAGAPAASTPWRISGDLSEACTCSVPCSCNFGQGASPRSYCWALFSLDIQKGSCGAIRLDGLHLAAGSGANGIVFYIDDRASPQQAAALRAIANHIWSRVRTLAAADPAALESPELKLLAVKTARIEQKAGKTGNRLVIGNQGIFESDYILGIDGKTPVIVENNWSWNIQHGIKGKTRRLHYKDAFGNAYDETATNANQGKFDWTDKTPIYLR